MGLFAAQNQFPPGHLRHLKISQQQGWLWIRLAQGLKGHRRVLEENGFVTAHLQNGLDDIADHRFVVHDIKQRGCFGGR